MRKTTRKTTRKTLFVLLFAAKALCAQGQDEPVSHRFGLNLQVMIPTDTAAKLYQAGYSVGIPFYFHSGEPVEGRLRVEIGHFNGKSRVVSDFFGVHQESVTADTRFVGYDWLVRMGEARYPGADFLVGIGGAHWYQTRTTSTTTGGSNVTRKDDGYGEKVGFVLSLGFIFHITRNVGIEAKQMLTSLPGTRRDFTDAELSHTSVGVAFRF